MISTYIKVNLKKNVESSREKYLKKLIQISLKKYKKTK